MILVNQKKEYITTWILPETHNELMLRLVFASAANHSTTLIRKEKLDFVNRYNESYNKGAQDIELWTRICKVTRFHSLPGVYHQYQTGDDMKKREAIRSKIAFETRRHFIEELLNEVVTETDYASMCLCLGSAPPDKIDSQEAFAAISLLNKIIVSMRGKGYLDANLDPMYLEVLKLYARILNRFSGFNENLLPEMLQNSSSRSLSKYYWLNNDFPKIARWLGYGIFAPKDFISDIIKYYKKHEVYR
jgi:hypothetical protein